MGCILGDNQHKRFNNLLVIIPGIDLQFYLGIFMNPDTVFEFDLLQSVGGYSSLDGNFPVVATAGSLTKPSVIALLKG